MQAVPNMSVIQFRTPARLPTFGRSLPVCSKANLARCCAIASLLVASLAVFDARPVWSAEKPQLTMLVPAGGQIGTSVDVVAQGKFPVWPLKTWTDSPHIEWKCQTEAGKLQAVIGPDAEPGLHWLRLFDDSGASAVRPYLVGRSAQATEVEPNDRVADAQVVPQLPFVIHGILNKQADVDLFAVRLAQGQLLAATIDSHKWLSSPADASLQILSSRGFILEENLDHVGLDPYLEFTAPHADTYYVRVFGFPATPNSTVAFSGGSDWLYRLRLETQATPLASALDVAKQSELTAAATQIASGAHTSVADALPVELPARLSGMIAEAKQANFVSFEARANAHYRFSVLARDCGSALDATLALHDPAGKELKRIDDVGQNRDPLLDWKSPKDGPVIVSISDFHQGGGKEYGYFLKIEERKADFSVSASSDLFEASVGKELDIVVTIARELDFAAPIQVRVEGLPESVTCPAVESVHGSDSAGKVTLKLKATAPLQMPLKIAATAAPAPAKDAAKDAAKEPAKDGTADAAAIVHSAATADLKPMWLSVVP